MRTFTNKKAVPVKQTAKQKLSNAGTSFDDYFQVHSNEWSADRI